MRVLWSLLRMLVSLPRVPQLLLRLLLLLLLLLLCSGSSDRCCIAQGAGVLLLWTGGCCRRGMLLFLLFDILLPLQTPPGTRMLLLLLLLLLLQQSFAVLSTQTPRTTRTESEHCGLAAGRAIEGERRGVCFYRSYFSKLPFVPAEKTFHGPHTPTSGSSDMHAPSGGDQLL
jgi:hypothetical protein